MIKNIKLSIGKLLAVPMLVLGLGFGGALLLPASDSLAANCDSGSPTLSGGVGCAKGDETPEELFADGGVFQQVTNVMLFLIGAIAVIMLIIGGIRYTTSNGNPEQVSAAKNTIMYAIIGIVVAILAYAVVNFVVTTFAET